MKTIAPFILFFLFIIDKGHAQSLIGLTGGYTKSFFRCNHRDYAANGIFSQVKNDFTFGIFYKERKEQHFNLIMDLNFLHRNTYADLIGNYGHGGGWNSQASWNLYSLGFKVAPEFSIGNRFRFYISTGPYLSYIFKSLAYGHGGDWHISGNWMTGDSLTINNTNWEVNGASTDFLYGPELAISSQSGFEFPISKKIKLHADANYILGLATSAGAKLYSASVKCNTFFVSAGISFSLNNTCITTRVKKFFDENPNTSATDYQEK